MLDPTRCRRGQSSGQLLPESGRIRPHPAGTAGAQRDWRRVAAPVVEPKTGNEVRLDGGPGDDTIDAGDGEDLVYDPEGNNTVDCGPGNDTSCTDTLAHFNTSVNCEVFQQASPSAARESTAAAKAAARRFK